MPADEAELQTLVAQADERALLAQATSTSWANGMGTAVDAVKDDVNKLRGSATDTSADDDVAIGAVLTSATVLHMTLSDCCPR